VHRVRRRGPAGRQEARRGGHGREDDGNGRKRQRIRRSNSEEDPGEEPREEERRRVLVLSYAYAIQRESRAPPWRWSEDQDFRTNRALLDRAPTM